MPTPSVETVLKRTVRIVSSGKGGAGKTTVMAALVHHLSKLRPGARVFVLDADPASTLPIALGLDAKPEVGIGQLKDELSKLPIQGDQQDKARFVMGELRRRAIRRVEVGGITVDFAYMGHHQEDSCLCAYNDAVNQTLTALIESNLYDYMVIDRDAGLEHINRSVSVYADPRTVLAVVAWPNTAYLSIAKEAMDTADALGASPHRLIVVNNLRGKDLTSEDVEDMLERHDMGAWPFVIFPPLDGVEEAPVGEMVEACPEAQEVLAAILGLMDDVKYRPVGAE